MNIKEIHLIGSDKKEYVVPVERDEELDMDVAVIPKNWSQEMVDAFSDIMHPKGYMTMHINKTR